VAARDIGREIANDAVRLVRAEVELAKADLRDAVRGARNALFFVVLASLTLLLALIFALGALADGLGPALLGASWAGWGVLALVFVAVALLSAWSGYRNVRRSIAGTKDAVGSIKEDVEWVKLLTRRSTKGS
jgi:phosphatidylglycerophosphate synthase